MFLSPVRLWHWGTGMAIAHGAHGSDQIVIDGSPRPFHNRVQASVSRHWDLTQTCSLDRTQAS